MFCKLRPHKDASHCCKFVTYLVVIYCMLIFITPLAHSQDMISYLSLSIIANSVDDTLKLLPLKRFTCESPYM